MFLYPCPDTEQNIFNIRLTGLQEFCKVFEMKIRTHKKVVQLTSIRHFLSPKIYIIKDTVSVGVPHKQ